ncbi:MAG: phospho-N-acetylmuramoyl-pentapeptide-transferase [Bacteroidales bacterium]|jgi:phospho-N-acetylmuramoyl-pentapeptide-transferase
MFYYLFDYLERVHDLPGAGMFQYISFRSALAAIFSLFISMILGKYIIKFLRKNQISETIRDLGLEGQKEKEGTPTIGGIIILGAIVIPTLLFAKLDNVYVLLMLFVTIWLGFIGGLDDYIKVYKHDKKGLKGKFKVIGQIVAGVVVASVIFFSPSVEIREKVVQTKEFAVHNSDSLSGFEKIEDHSANFSKVPTKSTKTTIPFVKNNEFDYNSILGLFGINNKYLSWIVYLVIVVFIVIAVSNSANLTDGIDGLAAGTSAIIGATLGLLAWVSGNIVFADYLNIMYIPNSGELVIFISAFVGACIGFLWYNTYPAQVFMGDTGSLALGGIIATYAIIIRKELLIPILCGVFLIESLSVLIQVSYFKITRKRTGVGKRVFLMTPLHHHYQKKGYKEPKIVMRFFIIGILLAILTVVTLKIR